MSRSQNSIPYRGFTLIDLLVSLTLLTIVMTMVYGSFLQISTHAAARTEELTQRQELRLLLHLVAGDLEAAQWLPRFNQIGPGFRTGIISDTEFQNGRDFTAIHFHTARPSRFFRRLPEGLDPGLHEVGYRVRRDERGEALRLVRREDFYLDNDMEDGGNEVVIAEEIEEFLVEFLSPDADPNAFEEQWEKRWDANTRAKGSEMPIAIRVTLALKTKKGVVLREQLSFNRLQDIKP